MGFPVVVSDALNRRVPKFDAAKLAIFQLAVADIVKGRKAGELAHTSPASGRRFYVLEAQQYKLYYSRGAAQDATQAGQAESLVFEEFLSAGEENLIMDLFAEGPD